MSKKHDGCTRCYYHTAEAWYAKTALTGDLVDEIMIGMYDLTGGGTSGEFALSWEGLGVGDLSVKLVAWDDSWSALSLFPELLAWMAGLEGRSPTPAETISKLREWGVKDITPRQREGQSDWRIRTTTGFIRIAASSLKEARMIAIKDGYEIVLGKGDEI